MFQRTILSACLVLSSCSTDTKGPLPDAEGMDPDLPDAGQRRCGDGVLSAYERCEDGNAVSDDGCSSACVPEPGWKCSVGEECKPVCGDSLTVGEEVCDPPLAVPSCVATESAQCDGTGTPYCSQACDQVLGACGDGKLQGEFEDCDDALSPGCQNCAARPGWNCEKGVCVEFCGNGITSASEACDDGNQLFGDYCTPDCTTITGRCGDAIHQKQEACDDGNDAALDGCSDSCQIEYAATCTTTEGQPDTCELSSVPGSTRIDSLSDEQISRFCAWRAGTVGYPNQTVCGGVTWTPTSPSTCERDLTFLRCETSYTVGQVEACVAACKSACCVYQGCNDIPCD